MKRTFIGDRVSAALSAIGITEARVSSVLGRSCGCGGRREALNALHRWAERVLSGKTERAEDYLNEILEDHSS